MLGPVVVSVSRGSGCVRFFFRLVGWWGGLGVFFPLGALCSSGSGVGLRGLVGVGGFGGCRVGLGFFSPASVVRPGPVPVLAWLRGLVLVVGCSGFVWRV